MILKGLNHFVRKFVVCKLKWELANQEDFFFFFFLDCGSNSFFSDLLNNNNDNDK